MPEEMSGEFVPPPRGSYDEILYDLAAWPVFIEAIREQLKPMRPLSALILQQTTGYTSLVIDSSGEYVPVSELHETSKDTEEEPK